MLEGRVIWITGASRGIGAEVARECARRGAQTILVAREPRSLNAVVETLSASGPAPVILDYDITNPKSVAGAFARVTREVGRLDGLVNNAGVMQDALLGMITSAQVEATFAVNVYAAVYHMQYASRLMSRVRSGSIVNVSSIIGRNGNVGQTVYAASKAALIGATLSASKELAPHNVRVNAVAPGFIETDMTRQLPQHHFEARASAIGMGRVGAPSDVARAICYLLSDDSAYVTGQVLGVDGSMRV